MASLGLTFCKLFIFCKILAWRRDGGPFSGSGALNSSYLLHFHQHIGLKDKLFIFKNILAIRQSVGLCPFIFNKILGATFIFNISSGAGSLFDFHQQIGGPPHLSQARLFHPHHQRRVWERPPRYALPKTILALSQGRGSPRYEGR